MFYIENINVAGYKSNFREIREKLSYFIDSHEILAFPYLDSPLKWGLYVTNIPNKCIILASHSKVVLPERSDD